MNPPKKRRRRGAAALLAAFVLIAGGLFALRLATRRYYNARYPLEYQQIVSRYAGETGLPPSFVYAVIHTESVFDPEAVSKVDARGLMQIRRDTFEWIQQKMGGEALDYDESCFDPEVNVRYGTYLLRRLYDEFGSYKLALCAYHAGRGTVQRWLRDPEISPDGETVPEIPFPDTNWYVLRVGETREIYQRLYELE